MNGRHCQKLEYEVPGTGHNSANGGVLLPSVWNRVLSHRFGLFIWPSARKIPSGTSLDILIGSLQKSRATFSHYLQPSEHAARQMRDDT